MAEQSLLNDPASLALQKFRANKYDECLSHLNELSNHFKQNKRIAFNKAVVEFYQSDFKNIDSFRKELLQITGQLWPSVNINDIKSPSDCVIYYSYAVILYHTRNYSQAYTILEKLFTFRDQLSDSTLACSIVLLLMEVCLCRRLPAKVTLFGDQAVNMFQKKTPEMMTDLYRKLIMRGSLMCRKVITPPTNIKSLEWLFLRAHQQYINGDLSGATATLSQCQQVAMTQAHSVDLDDYRSPTISNMGVLYYGMKKYNLAVKCMQEAVKEHLKSLKSEMAARLFFTKDRPLYIFNLGISLLKANRPEDAFECLVEAARHFPNNPRIWLRLAECCVIHYNKTNKQDPVVRKISSGPHAKLIPGPVTKDKYSISAESYAIPTLSLEFAALCLMNAITLLPMLEPSGDYEQCLYQAPPSSPMNYKQYCNLRCSVLLVYTFVCLRLNDPLSALHYCNALLSRPQNQSQKALAHLYAAEALIGLDRISEAIDHLNPTVIHDIAAKMNPIAQEFLGVAVWLNGAVCHAVKGDSVTARNILLSLNSPKALQLQLYLETIAGNMDNCRALLRKFKPIPN